jgi:alpha-1,6-mannosyltransferase
MDSPKLQICDVVQFYSTLSGGVRRYIHEKRSYLRKNTPHSHCLVIPSHRDAMTRNDRITVYEIKSPKLIGSNSYRMLINKKKILKAIAAEKPDLIEVGDPYRAAWIGLKAGKINRIPVVAFYHSDYPRALDRTLRKYAGPRIEALVSPIIQKYLIRLYNRMSATVVSSQRCYDALQNIGIKNLRQIALGTNLESFTPHDSRQRIFKELEISEDHKLLLFVGRLAREKNIRSLFAMMDILRQGNQPHHLVLIGDGEWRDEVRQKSREEKDISWLHFSDSPERLADFYSAADLFVHAGDCETFGLVSLEAQACGTRVLAVKGGGLDEGLKWENPQIMAENTTGEALARAVGQVWELEEGKIERGLRRQTMEKHYSWNATFSKLTELYTQLAQKNTPTGKSEENIAHEAEDPALLSR